MFIVAFCKWMFSNSFSLTDQWSDLSNVLVTQGQLLPNGGPRQYFQVGFPPSTETKLPPQLCGFSKKHITTTFYIVFNIKWNTEKD